MRDLRRVWLVGLLRWWSSVSGRRTLSPRDAVERWLDQQRAEKAASTVRDYGYRLKLFVEWCEANSIESIADLDGWELDSYATHRQSQDIRTITLSNELKTLRQFLDYCERIEVAPSGLHQKVDPPTVSGSEEVSETKLDGDDGEALLTAFRETAKWRASNHHALLELIWNIGARMGACRALDVGDFDAGAGTVEFHHRPRSETPLKNDGESERIVGLPDAAVSVVDEWIDGGRPAVTDDHGREPLLATSQGRPHRSTLRQWCYYATLPCRWQECPHGKRRETCEWFTQTRSGECPSRLGPHAVRTGSLTWQRSRGVPVEVVARRADVTPEVIRKHYDHPSKREAFEKRRRPYLDQLSIQDREETDSDDSDHDE